MLIGARQDCVLGDTLEDRMRILKALGYDFVELALTRSEIAELDAHSADYYRNVVESTGLPILSTSMGHFGHFASLNDEERAEIVSHVDKLITFTHDIGADAILLATQEESLKASEYLGVYRQHLLPLADKALDLGVTLALEHVNWYKPWALAELVKGLNHPAVGIYFDMGNCLYVGENPKEQAKICAPYAAHLHIKGGPVAPLAAMPLEEIKSILEAGGFHGRGCLEIMTVEGNRHLSEAMGLLKMAGYK